ncbi:MAG: mechanosensitive ion channel domain-containing protein [Desulfobacterales bacterium]
MSRTVQSFKKSYQSPFSWALFLVVFLVLVPGFKASSRAQEIQAIDPPQTRQDATGLYQRFEESFDQAIETETSKLEAVSAKLKSTKSEQDTLDTRISWLRLMISTHSNLLLSPETGIQALERAQIRHAVAAGYAREEIRKTEKEIQELENQSQKAEEQAGFYKREAVEIRFQPPHLGGDKTFEAKLETLISILGKKRDKTEQILEIYNTRLQRLKRLLPELESLSEKIDAQIETRKKRSIFERGPSPVIPLWKGELKDDFATALERSRQWVFRTVWQVPEFVSRGEYFAFLAVFLFFFALLEFLLYWVGRYCKRLMQSFLDTDKFWQYLAAKLIQKTIMLAGAAAYIYFYPVRPIFRVAPVFILIPLALRIIVLLVITRWGVVFLRAFAARTEDVVYHRLYLPLNRLFYGVFVYGAVYFFISRVICYNCITLVTWRLLFEFLLLLWAVRFFTLFLREAPHSGYAGKSWFSKVKPVFAAFGCFALLPGIIAEIMGFGGLAGFWYAGLAKTAAVVFLTVILLRLLRESDVPAHIERSEEAAEGEPADRQPYPVRWLLVRLFRLVGVAAALFGLFLAWGAPKTFLADILYAINYKITIGDFQLSLIGFVYALIVLLVIHTLAVVIKEVLRGRILKDTEMEAGLKDSIVRITGYVLWLAGILVALRVVGISATALTVVFGALGIGIGFGLQNIFNNFLSGIILLFERPIQVGDVIEIGGIWGTVREINVRSTQVRTFDNADLIIPNSDFISQSLTNWSFRDARIRRTVEVGVAYGSDTELVRSILIEVAYQHPRILRRPHPEVLFSDFGESALIFKLRFWAHIDWFLIVETDVRFDIDRRFRENNIVIPFPQRDLHFKSDNPTPVPDTGAQEQET